MNKEKRRLHQKMIHKLMHKVGGRASAAWYGERTKINKKVFDLIVAQKTAAFYRKQRAHQEKGIISAIEKATTE